MTHSEERAFPCKIGDCKEAYKNQSHLSRHQKSAHNIEPPSKRSQKLIRNENGELVPLPSEPKAKKFKPSEPSDFDEATNATSSSVGSKFNDNLPGYSSYDYPSVSSEPPQQIQPSPQTNLVSNSYPPSGDPPPMSYPSEQFEWQSMERNLNNVLAGGGQHAGGSGHPNAFLEAPPHSGNSFHDINKNQPNSQQFINNNLNMHSYQVGV